MDGRAGSESAAYSVRPSIKTALSIWIWRTYIGKKYTTSKLGSYFWRAEEIFPFFSEIEQFYIWK